MRNTISTRFVSRQAAGVVAGAVGTSAMDLLLYRRYRADGGRESAWNWESAAGLTSWEQASAPGQLGRKLARVVLRREPPDEWARRTTNTVHWATGIGWGLQYAALAAKTPRHPTARMLALGPTVWAVGYVILPIAGVYKPIWKYDQRTLAKDLSAHMIYGIATSAALAGLARSESGK